VTKEKCHVRLCKERESWKPHMTRRKNEKTNDGTHFSEVFGTESLNSSNTTLKDIEG
jgi:hypothetical protein